MADITHLINGQDLGEPRNWQDLEITIDWENQKESGTINVSDLSFVLEAKDYLQNRVMDGLTGGVGVFEGEPYQIVVGNQSDPEYVFNGYLDFTDGLTVIGGEEIICGLKKRKGEDWLNDVADSFSFAYLYDQGVIKSGDFTGVPYVINYVPDGLQVITLSMSIFMMTKEIIENIEYLSESIADAANAAAPGTGQGIGANAGGPVVTFNINQDLGDIILLGLKVISRIAYTVAIIVAIKNLIELLFEELLPPQRTHLGMSFRRMLEKGCEHLDLTFESSIDELKWVHIPLKSKKGGERGETGFPTNTEEIYTFGGLIRVMRRMFNADYRIVNGVFTLERKDSFKNPTPYRLPSYFNLQDRLLDQFKLNTDEMMANYNIIYQFDIQDQNTLDNSDGRVFQAITTPLVKRNEDVVNIKNVSEVNLPFSLGLQKTKLNRVEEVAKSLGKIADEITSIFGGGSNFESRIRNRVGSLLLSSNFLTIGKIVEMAGGKLAASQREKLNTRRLWDKYHFINSFAEYQGEHNQYILFEELRVPMSLKEFMQILDDNEAIDDQGNEYEILKAVYSPYNTTAVLDYRIKRQYTNNLKVELL